MTRSSEGSAPGARTDYPGSLASAITVLPQGVCVASWVDGGVVVTHAVESIMFVSETPPLVALVVSGRTAQSLKALRGGFGVNILAGEQLHVYRRISEGRSATDIDWHWTSGQTPILGGCAAWIDAEVDHSNEVVANLEIVVARVRSHGENSRRPLIAVRGGLGTLPAAVLSTVSDDTAAALALVTRIQPELESLAADLGGRAAVSTVVGGQLVIIASAGVVDQTAAPTLPVGFRIPALAPLAATFYAWESPDEVHHWLDLVDRIHEPEAARLHELQRLAEIRARGYSVFLRRPRSDSVWNRIGKRVLPSEVEELGPDDIEMIRNGPLDPLGFSADEVTAVEWFAMPVFGPTGKVVLTLSVDGMQLPRDWSDFEPRLARLERAASNSTRILGGVVPLESSEEDDDE